MYRCRDGLGVVLQVESHLQQSSSEAGTDGFDASASEAADSLSSAVSLLLIRLVLPLASAARGGRIFDRVCIALEAAEVIGVKAQLQLHAEAP